MLLVLQTCYHALLSHFALKCGTSYEPIELLFLSKNPLEDAGHRAAQRDRTRAHLRWVPLRLLSQGLAMSAHACLSDEIYTGTAAPQQDELIEGTGNYTDLRMP